MKSIYHTVWLAPCAALLPAPFHHARAQSPDPEQALLERGLRALKAELGLDDRTTFVLKHLHKDEMGHVHARFQQYFKGLKVWGGEVILHRAPDGSFAAPSLSVKRDVEVNPTPSLGPAEILARVDQDLHPSGAYAAAPEVELVIYPEITRRLPGGGDAEAGVDATAVEKRVSAYTLAYHVHVLLASGAGAEGAGSMDYLLDAHTGALLKKWNSLRTGAAVSVGHSQYNGKVRLDTNRLKDGRHELRDVKRGGLRGNATYNMDGRGSTETGSPMLQGSLYTSDSDVWGDGRNYQGGDSAGRNGETAAVDAHYALQVTWDMYRDLFGRNGVDGRGRSVASRVHFGQDYDNAFWLDECFCITYGDGSRQGSMTPLDIGAHELSHGLCSSTAGLEYHGEAGGLNEANSDILAAVAELYEKGGMRLPDRVDDEDPAWTIGERLQEGPIRWMRKPRKDKLSCEYWSPALENMNPHLASGPMNRCFFFLSQGASGDPANPSFSVRTPAGFKGLGPLAAARIWYRTLCTRLTSTSGYAEAREGAIEAARELFGRGSAQEAAVQNAFAAINVGRAWAGRKPPLRLEPAGVRLGPSGSLRFKGLVGEESRSDLSWKASAGWVDGDGTYHAPGEPGLYKVQAALKEGGPAAAEAVVAVCAGSAWSATVEADSEDCHVPDRWRSTGPRRRSGKAYSFAQPSPYALDGVTYDFDIPEDGDYEVLGWWPAGRDQNTATRMEVRTERGVLPLRVDQRNRGGQWVSLGIFHLQAGGRPCIRVSRNSPPGGYVVAGAFRVRSAVEGLEVQEP